MAQQVYITDDDPLMRRFLKKALDHEGMATKTFESGVALLSALDTLQPGVILLDIRMPELDGVQVLEQMRSRTRIHPVLILSSHGDVATAVRAVRAGAIDFIEKPFSVSSLVQRVRELQDLVESWQCDRSSIADAKDRLSILTEREMEVAKEMAVGLSNKEIARKLDVSPRTVEAHRARLMKRLGVSSLADVVRLFI